MGFWKGGKVFNETEYLFMKTSEHFGTFWKMKCLFWFVEELLHRILRSSLDLWGNNYKNVSSKTKNNQVCLNASRSATLCYYFQMVWNWIWTYKYSHDTMILKSLYVMGQESGELDNWFKWRPRNILLKKVRIIWKGKLKWLEIYELRFDGFKSL